MPSTLTVAQLRAQGFTHIEARCCVVACVPFRMLEQQGKITDATTYAALTGRLRCKECGRVPEPDAVRPWRQYLDQEPAGPNATYGMMPPVAAGTKKPGG